MKSKSLLTSIAAIAFALPAMAEPTTSGTFPTGENGYMQENYIYTNAATSTNMDGVYEGTVNATAYYDDIPYTINAGQYLPASAEAVATCTAGNYCPGLPSAVTYSTTTNQGLNECPTGYGNSAAGATAETDCYRQCSGNVTIAHASGVTGNDYYGAGVDTCAPTACENGWHVKAAVTAPDLTNIEPVDVGYHTMDEPNDDNVEKYGLTVIGEFAVDYGNTRGVIRGRGYCSSHEDNTLDNLEDDDSGDQCYCRFDNYTPSAGTAQPISMPWVYNGSDENCSMNCPQSCALAIQNNYDGFAETMFGFLQSTPAMCEANTITINWGDVDPNYAGQNNEGTAIYGEDIRTPFKAATKPGQTFKGWKFSAPQSNNNSGNNNG